MYMRGWWGISGMCEWMGIQVIEKHRRTVMKVILVGGRGTKGRQEGVILNIMLSCRRWYIYYT